MTANVRTATLTASSIGQQREWCDLVTRTLLITVAVPNRQPPRRGLGIPVGAAEQATFVCTSRSDDGTDRYRAVQQFSSSQHAYPASLRPVRQQVGSIKPKGSPIAPAKGGGPQVDQKR